MISGENFFSDNQQNQSKQQHTEEKKLPVLKFEEIVNISPQH